MPLNTCLGATLNCTFGVAPSALAVLPAKAVNTAAVPAANIMDHVPLINVPPFGMCSCPSNPAVAAATTAAAGVLTPMPCVPVTPMPWVPGSPKVLLRGFPALNNTSKLNCIWGGVISISNAGQMKHNVP
ncbi:DUF4280 domain-containing protein [Pseudorhodoferax sp.]|uniref:DUF4280 domain-containing protein n=1 Tax=Pseudorhodoferax sp. TaxID=1993553 RepID=UPI002DD638D8|nr:DUF4280 domain-containing protein [Pseudorhodoferax sp.]